MGRRIREISLGLAVIGFGLALLLHVSSFIAPPVEVVSRWLAVGVSLLGLVSLLLAGPRSQRRSSGLPASFVAQSVSQRLLWPVRTGPLWLRLLPPLQIGLIFYAIAWMIPAFNAPHPDYVFYSTRAWSAMGMYWCLYCISPLARSLGWGHESALATGNGSTGG